MLLVARFALVLAPLMTSFILLAPSWCASSFASSNLLAASAFSFDAFAALFACICLSSMASKGSSTLLNDESSCDCFWSMGEVTFWTLSSMVSSALCFFIHYPAEGFTIFFKCLFSTFLFCHVIHRIVVKNQNARYKLNFSAYKV